MPRFRVYQFRDAYKIYTTIVDADDAEHAKQLAEDDECEWQYSCVNQYDDREIPLEEIEQLETEDNEPDRPATVRGKIWLLRIESDYSSSVDVYTNETEALKEWARELAGYIESYAPEAEQERLKADPRAAHGWLENRDAGFPNGDTCYLDEREIELEVANV